VTLTDRIGTFDSGSPRDTYEATRNMRAQVLLQFFSGRRDPATVSLSRVKLCYGILIPGEWYDYYHR